MYEDVWFVFWQAFFHQVCINSICFNSCGVGASLHASSDPNAILARFKKAKLCCEVCKHLWPMSKLVCVLIDSCNGTTKINILILLLLFFLCAKNLNNKDSLCFLEWFISSASLTISGICAISPTSAGICHQSSTHCTQSQRRPHLNINSLKHIPGKASHYSSRLCKIYFWLIKLLNSKVVCSNIFLMSQCAIKSLTKISLMPVSSEYVWRNCNWLAVFLSIMVITV